MKKWLNWFHTRTATVATETAKPEPIIGITEAEYNVIHKRVLDECEKAAKRQKPGSTRPSGYMNGICTALSILESVVPHNMQEGA